MCKTITDLNCSGVTDTLLEFGKDNYHDEQAKANITQSVKDMLNMYSPSETPAKVLEGIMTIIREHEINIDSDVGNLIINLICIDSVAKAMDPEYNIFDRVMPYLTVHQAVGDHLFEYFYPFAKY